MVGNGERRGGNGKAEGCSGGPKFLPFFSAVAVASFARNQAVSVGLQLGDRKHQDLSRGTAWRGAKEARGGELLGGRALGDPGAGPAAGAGQGPVGERRGAQRPLPKARRPLPQGLAVPLVTVQKPGPLRDWTAIPEKNGPALTHHHLEDMQTQSQLLFDRDTSLPALLTEPPSSQQAARRPSRGRSASALGRVGNTLELCLPPDHISAPSSP